MTTKQTGHTPGPWVARNRDVFYMAKDGDKDISVFIADCDCNRLGVDKANARLIAAAPELLEACKEMYIELLAYQDKHPKIKSNDMVRWEQALAKAEGETR